MRTQFNGYVVGNPRAFSREFEVEYTPEQITGFLIQETKYGGVVIVESARHLADAKPGSGPN